MVVPGQVNFCMLSCFTENLNIIYTDTNIFFLECSFTVASDSSMYKEWKATDSEKGYRTCRNPVAEGWLA